MRDVKSNIRLVFVTFLYRFYLNYEGCKDLDSAVDDDIDFSFIWTMRDVKVAEAEQIINNAVAFYLNYEGCKAFWGAGIVSFV